MNGQLQIGRSTITTPIVRSNRSRGSLGVQCWHSADAGSDDNHAVARALRNDLQGQIGDLVSVVWDGPALLTGFYVLREAELSTIHAGGRFDCDLVLDYVGSKNDLIQESRLVGKAKANDFSVTDSSSEPFLAPPPHDNYDPRHTTTIARKLEGYADLTVYRDIDFAIDPKWSADPEDWYTGAATVQRRAPLYPELGPIGGTDLFIEAVEDVELSNGMVRFWGNGSGFYVSFWDGTAWRDKALLFVTGGVAVSVWNAVAILDNRPEKCALRFTGGTTGRATLDVSVRRGELGVSCLLTSDASGSLGVMDAAATAMTVTSNRALYTAADANGHKLGFWSMRNFTQFSAGYIFRATTTQFDVGIGMELNGAAVGNQAAAMALQYAAAIAENVRTVRR